MSARVGIGDRFIYMTNSGWSGAVDDAIAVAKSVAREPVHRDFISRLEIATQGLFPGYDPDFAALFPSLDEKKFWTTCFLEAGRRIALGQIGHSSAISPARHIFEVMWCADLLRDEVRKLDRGWLPEDEDTSLSIRAIQADEKAYREMYRKNA
jgi:hypothetical protein